PERAREPGTPGQRVGGAERDAPEAAAVERQRHDDDGDGDRRSLSRDPGGGPCLGFHYRLATMDRPTRTKARLALAIVATLIAVPPPAATPAAPADDEYVLQFPGVSQTDSNVNQAP